MKTRKPAVNLDQLAATIYVKLLELEWPREDAKTANELAERAFDLADTFASEAFAQYQAAALTDHMGMPD